MAVVGASPLSSSLNNCFTSSCPQASCTPRPSHFHQYASIHRIINTRVLANQSSFFASEARSHLGSSSDLAALARDCLRYPKGSPKNIIQASLFGVGAPEAVVIAVVALVVFGPKGLAEIARTLGKSLRAFQPTLQELQEVSKEFKNTLEQEMGLDELRSYGSKYPEKNVQSDLLFQSPANAKQNGPTKNGVYTTEEYARITEEQTKVLVSAEQQQDGPTENGVYKTEKYARIIEEQTRVLASVEQRQGAEAAVWDVTPPIINARIADPDNNGLDGADNSVGTK